MSRAGYYDQSYHGPSHTYGEAPAYASEADREYSDYRPQDFYPRQNYDRPRYDDGYDRDAVEASDRGWHDDDGRPSSRPDTPIRHHHHHHHDEGEIEGSRGIDSETSKGFAKGKHELGGDLLGAAAGAFLGHELGHSKMATLGGGAIGAFGAHEFEKHLQKKHVRQAEDRIFKAGEQRGAYLDERSDRGADHRYDEDNEPIQHRHHHHRYDDAREYEYGRRDQEGSDRRY